MKIKRIMASFGIVVVSVMMLNLVLTPVDGDAGFPGRPKIKVALGKNVGANAIASTESRSMSLRPPLGSPNKTPMLTLPEK